MIGEILACQIADWNPLVFFCAITIHYLIEYGQQPGILEYPPQFILQDAVVDRIKIFSRLVRADLSGSVQGNV